MAEVEDTGSTDLYICHVCLEDQTERSPRLLSCHHSFCESCLKSLVKEEKVACPTCRQVTPVKEDDVTKLSSNFLLFKMKEHINQLNVNKFLLCQMCKVKTAAKRCKECTYLICPGCLEKHNRIQGFVNHKIYSVCPVHQEGVITHVCVTCVKAVCSLCIFQHHSSHADYVVTFDDGIKEIKRKISGIKFNSETKLSVLENRKKFHEDKLFHCEEQTTEVEALHYSYVEKTEETWEVLEKLKASSVEMKNILTACESDRIQICNVASTAQEALTKDDFTILKNYSEIQKTAKENLRLTDIKPLDNLDIAEEILGSSGVGSSLFGQKAKLVYKETDIGKFGMKELTRIQTLKRDRAMIFDTSKNTFNIVFLSKTLEIKPTIFFEGNCDDVRLYQEKNSISTVNDMFLDYRNGNCIVRDSFKSGGLQTFQPNIKTLSNFFALDKHNFIIFDACLRRVYKFSQGCNKVKRIQCDIHIDDLSVLPFSNSYFITDSHNGKLHILDGDSITASDTNPFFSLPTLCIACPFGVLVAQKGGDCIKLVTRQGDWFNYQDIELEEDVRAIISMDYEYPYLWIAEDDSQNHCSIKCYLLIGPPNLVQETEENL